MANGIAFPVWQWAVLGLFGLLLAGSVGRNLLCHFVIRRTTFLSPDDPGADVGTFPRISVLVPAKDEAANIGGCLASLLAQDYPDFEILVADDRSEDATAEIVEAVARRDSRVRLLRIRRLPTGWTGKTHALHFAQQHATGEWLLFVDADAELHPRCLSVTLRDAADHDAGLLSLLPRMEMRSFWERVVQPVAATLLMVLFPLPRVNDRSRTDCGFANGQFLLVRRSVYDAIGGHEAVRDRFCEDVSLGRLVKQHRLGLRVVVAPRLAAVRMYASLGQIMRGWCRIFYSAADANANYLRAFTAVLFLLSGLPYAAAVVCLAVIAGGAAGAFTWSLLGLAVAQELLQTAVYFRAYRAGGSPVGSLAWRWLATGVMLVVLLRTVRLCRTHAVDWRGTRYLAFPQSGPAVAARSAAA